MLDMLITFDQLQEYGIRLTQARHSLAGEEGQVPQAGEGW